MSTGEHNLEEYVSTIIPMLRRQAFDGLTISITIR